MRGAILFATAAIASFIAAQAPTSAQTAYSYQWCARTPKTDGSTTWCYFTSYQQCKATVLGLAGYCYHNPAYRGGGHLYR